MQQNKPEKMGQNCVIGENASIGSHVILGHNCIIEDGVIIGDNSYIDSGAILRRGGCLERTLLWGRIVSWENIRWTSAGIVFGSIIR